MLRTDDLELRAMLDTLADVRRKLAATRRPDLAATAAGHVGALLGGEWIEDAARGRIEARVRDRALRQLSDRERARVR